MIDVKANTGRIFFSYARSDSEVVLALAQRLRRDGRNAWVDQLDIAKGSRWDDAIERALQDCGCLLVVLSPASTGSHNVLDEVSYALESGKTVIPILLKPCNVPFRLKRFQYIDFSVEPEQGYGELAQALDAFSAAPAPAPAAAAQAEPPAPERSATQLPPMAHAQEAAPAPVIAPLAAPPRSPTPPPPRAAADGTPPRSKAGWIMAAAAGVVIAGSAAFFASSPSAPQPDGQAQSVGLSPRAGATPAAAPPAAPPAAAFADEKRELITFVQAYVAAQNQADAAALLKFYGPQVDYFSQPNASHDFILKDKQRYYRRWPAVTKTLDGPVQVLPTPAPGAAEVSYLVRHKIHSDERAETNVGFARETLRLERGPGGGWLIAVQQAQVFNVKH